MSDDERFALVEKMRRAQLLFQQRKHEYSGDKQGVHKLWEEARDLGSEVDAMLKSRKEGPGLFDAQGELAR